MPKDKPVCKHPQQDVVYDHKELIRQLEEEFESKSRWIGFVLGANIYG